jgi:hypothetical protein
MKYAVPDAMRHKFMLFWQRGTFVVSKICVRIVPDIDAPQAVWRLSRHKYDLEISAQDKRVARPISADERIYCLMNHDWIHPCITHPGLVEFEFPQNWRRLTDFLYSAF